MGKYLEGFFCCCCRVERMNCCQLIICDIYTRMRRHLGNIRTAPCISNLRTSFLVAFCTVNWPCWHFLGFKVFYMSYCINIPAVTIYVSKNRHSIRYHIFIALITIDPAGVRRVIRYRKDRKIYKKKTHGEDDY